MKPGAVMVPFCYGRISLLLLSNDRLHCQEKKEIPKEEQEQEVSNSANQHHSFCMSAQPSVMFLSFMLDALITVFFSLTHLKNVEILSSLHQLIPRARNRAQNSAHHRPLNLFMIYIFNMHHYGTQET